MSFNKPGKLHELFNTANLSLDYDIKETLKRIRKLKKGKSNK